MSNLDEPIFGTPIHYPACKGCRYSHYREKVYDNDHDTAYCKIYSREIGFIKPKELQRAEAKCEFYEPE